MKILHITATHLNPIGGIPIVLKNLLDEQNKYNDLTSRLLSIKTCSTEIDSNFFDFLGNEKLEDYLIKFKPDVVIIHSFYYIEYIKVYRILNKLHIKYFIEPHGSFVRKSLKKSLIKKMIANTTIFYRLIHKAFGYIYLSKDERDSSIYHTKNDLIIPNGIAPPLLNQTINHNDKIVHFYYIGRYDIYEKGINLFKKAIKLLDKMGEKYIVDFYGIGTPMQEKYINNIGRKLKNITVINHGAILGDLKYVELYQKGINILLSRHEGLPMTILEGWCMGNPCIVTKDVNVTSFIQDATYIGKVVNRNENEIANIMAFFARQYIKEKNKISLKCRYYTMEHFSWDFVGKCSRNELLKIK